MNSIYAIQPSGAGVTLKSVWTDKKGGIAAGCTAMTTVQTGGKTVLYAYNRSLQSTRAYFLTEKAPFVKDSGARPSLKGGPWDSISSFTLGNQQYLMAYRADTGVFAFYQINADLTVSKPYNFSFIRNTPTQGFTMVAPYTSLGQVYFAGYSFVDGLVANFSLSVVSSTADGTPPLLAQTVWYHHWAKGWTHFAFFQMGGSNFFFKINRDKLNVNIDHMQDNPANGSVEVGSYLQAKLPDALLIDNTAAIPWEDGEPRLLTYIKSSGATVVYRIHADCQGWTSLAAANTVKNAGQTIAYRVGNTSFALFYGA